MRSCGVARGDAGGLTRGLTDKGVDEGWRMSELTPEFSFSEVEVQENKLTVHIERKLDRPRNGVGRHTVKTGLTDLPQKDDNYEHYA